MRTAVACWWASYGVRGEIRISGVEIGVGVGIVNFELHILPPALCTFRVIPDLPTGLGSDLFDCDMEQT